MWFCTAHALRSKRSFIREARPGNRPTQQQAHLRAFDAGRKHLSSPYSAMSVWLFSIILSVELITYRSPPNCGDNANVAMLIFRVAQLREEEVSM